MAGSADALGGRHCLRPGRVNCRSRSTREFGKFEAICEHWSSDLPISWRPTRLRGAPPPHNSIATPISPSIHKEGPDTVAAFIADAFQKGLGCGLILRPRGEALAICCPLTIRVSEVDELWSVLDDATGDLG